jgi:hypothetical protein
MRQKMKVEVLVEYEEVQAGSKAAHASSEPDAKPQEKWGIKFLSVGVGDKPPCPLPPDAYTPKRFLRDLATAVHEQLKAGAKPEGKPAQTFPKDHPDYQPPAAKAG